MLITMRVMENRPPFLGGNAHLYWHVVPLLTSLCA